MTSRWPGLTRWLDLLLEPRLGHVLRPWPEPAFLVVRRLATEAGVSEQNLLARLATRPDPAALRAIVAAATVPHTAFFRHPEHFEHLEKILPVLAQRRGGIARIWSAGCATGEEAYSIAMTARAAHVEARILATDVSEAALTFARAGRYGRAPDPVTRTQRRGVPWLAPPEMQQAIRFEPVSLTAPDPTAGQGRFDIVFCRNVLIYFDRPHGEDLIDVLMSHVAPDGALVVAPTEGVVQGQRLHPVPDAPLGWLTPRRISMRRSAPPWLLAPKPRSVAPRPPTAPPPPPAVPEELPSPIELASRCLGSGNPEGAEHALSGFLNTEPDNAEAWFLLGEALFQRGEPVQARSAFQRAARHALDRPGAMDGPTLRNAAERRAEQCRRGA